MWNGWVLADGVSNIGESCVVRPQEMAFQVMKKKKFQSRWDPLGSRRCVGQS